MWDTLSLSGKIFTQGAEMHTIIGNHELGLVYF